NATDLYYIYYDTDIFGPKFSLPMGSRFSFSLYYGIGRAKIYETTLSGDSDYSINLVKSLLHALCVEIVYSTRLTDRIALYPVAGFFMHFLDNAGGYRRAYTAFFAVSGGYAL
ncbi:MAG: hypothetical protein JXA66_00620, partial [Oligoflexia bacterium]|nr:hypothetical protein [Oligoflexia bacterium]